MLVSMIWVGVAKYPTAFLTGLAVTLVVTPLLMRLAVWLGMVDRPDERRIHTKAVPRGGGVAVFLGFHAACAVTFFWPWGSFTSSLGAEWWLRFLPLSLLLLVIGLCDDRWGLRPWVKLGGQTLVAVLTYGSSMQFGQLAGISIPWYVELLVTVLWVLTLVNAFNLIDGMDGLAAGLGSIAALGLAGGFLLSRRPGDCLVVLGLMGACVGFLRYNFNPARIFLGDAGSMFIGYALAAVSLGTNTKSTTILALAVPILAVGVPMFDTFLAVWRRVARRFLHRLESHEKEGEAKVRVFGADLDHLHHRLLRSGWSQRQVAIVLYAASACLVMTGLAAVAFRSLSGTGLYVIVFVAASYVVVRHVAHVELWDSGTALAKGLARLPRRFFVVPLYLAADLMTLVGSLVVADALVTGHVSWRAVRACVYDNALFFAGVPLLILMAFGMYRRVWNRARTLDYFYLAAAATAGVVTGLGFSMMEDARRLAHDASRAGLMLMLILPGLVGVRLVRRLLHDGLADMTRRHGLSQNLPRTLLYGAGDMGILFLREEIHHAVRKGRRFTLCGFLDDDSNLHGRLIHGLPILGGMAALESVLDKTGATVIIVTADLQTETLSQLLPLAVERGVSILRWRTALSPLGETRRTKSAESVLADFHG